MKKRLLFILTISSLSFFLQAQGTWSTLKTGAGGWITGMDIHPDGTKFIRSDVGGAYRLDNGSNTWKQIVTNTSMPASDVHWSKYQGVLSLVTAPSNVNRCYMAYHNTIYSSDNQGENWERTNFPNLFIEPNSDYSKLAGERLAVDPLNENRVYFGSINRGLFFTEDGVNWSKINAVPNGTEERGIRSIVFDTSSGNSGNATNNIYVAVDGEGIFRSTDAGANFLNITNGLFTHNDPMFLDMEIDGAGNLYITGSDKTDDGSIESIGMFHFDGENWTQKFNEDLSISYSEIAIDPNNYDKIMLFSEGFSDTWLTSNIMSSAPQWEKRAMQRNAQNVPWMEWTETTWFTLGEIEFDPIIENRVWISFGTGTYYIDDDGSNPMIWNESSIGQEHLVSNDVVSFSNGNSLTAHWDFPVFLHTPENNYPEKHLPTDRFNSCWDLSQSPTDENFVTALIEDNRYCCWDEETRSSVYSEDGGLSWNTFPSMPEGEFDLIFGQIEVSAQDNNNLIWLPGGNRSPYISFDKGSTWQESELPGASENCCLSEPFFKRKALIADKVAAHTFYIYDWGSGDVFVTSDGGSNWNRNASVLPAWSFNAKITSVPGKEGHLFFVNGPEESEDLIEGLFRSTDGGSTWTEIEATTKVLNVSIGKAAPNAIYETVYICGEVDGVFGYYKSTDNCMSWSSLGKYPLGIYDWPVVMEANPFEYGNLKIGFKGNGFVEYSEEIDMEPVVTEHIHLDQFGYKPDFTKVAVISDPQVGYNSDANYTPGSLLKVIDESSGNTVFSGEPILWSGGATHGQSGDRGWHFDFSSLTAPGSYHILDEENNTMSYSFEISESVYNNVLKAATKMFYYNRCNMAKETPYAESPWTDGNNFNNNLQDENARYIYDQGNASLEKDLSGGWFDAGDYNKYVTFAHSTVHNLLTAYEENPMVFGDNWNLPESGNGIPDLLDEINWELEWLEKMSNEDGSVHIKMGSKNFSENISSPPSANFDQRYYGPICSAASIAVASMFAHAAVAYEHIEGLQTYGNSLELQAVTAFDYFLEKKNANDLDTACDDGSIVAGDADWEADFQNEIALIAAVYLFELTGQSIYGNYIIENVFDAQAVQNTWMGPYTNQVMEALFHYTTLSTADATTASTILNAVNPHVSQDWDGFYGQNDLDLYRSYMPDWSYHWGSNLPKAEYGNLNKMVVKYGINPSDNDSYLQKAEELVHYFHGVNPLGKVYLSNMASLGAENSVDELYHTWFYDGTEYDNVQDSYGPAPGFMPGGPNQNYSFSENTPPFGQPAQKSYMDFNTGYPDASWEITEPAIYYQAAYVRLLAGFANGDVTLPVNLLSFDAYLSGEDVELEWSTSNEVNTDRFEVEVSLDGSVFSTVGERTAAGNTTSVEMYTYTDEDVTTVYAGATVLYYRLRIVDQNGSFTFSDVRSIDLESTRVTETEPSNLKIYPNPVRNELRIESLDGKDITRITILNILGKTVLTKDAFGQNLRLDVSSLETSSYLILVEFDNRVEKQMFIKS